MLDFQFLRSDLFLLTLTVGLYCLGTLIYRRSHMPLLHPVLLTFVSVIVFLRCEGYRDREITTICRLAPGELDLEMNRARANVVPFTIKTVAVAA